MNVWWEVLGSVALQHFFQHRLQFILCGLVSVLRQYNIRVKTEYPFHHDIRVWRASGQVFARVLPVLLADAQENVGLIGIGFGLCDRSQKEVDLFLKGPVNQKFSGVLGIWLMVMMSLCDQR